MNQVTVDDIKTFITDDHLHFHGGYPYDNEMIGDLFVVAALKDDGATSLQMFSNKHLTQWVNEVNARITNGEPFECLADAINECRPEQEGDA